ncbi:cyclase [Maritimibacter sp. 55A14]|uniref:cyclase family protein n=1 Tax=Maritimibacter sp. 55A14 TaxID=2174844 RepID=UPI000D60B173|nr:cyclase family protein [Maritimibacter sp. 55A14]PWE28883.1 cyclase [Maritimibacter sp. 55A14]
MCDHCVIENVKRRMLSRRDLFKAAPAAVVAGAGLGAGALPALAQGAQSVVDMTHVVDADFPTYFAKPGIAMSKEFDFAENGFNLFSMTVNEHTGTHVDAPLHFSADGRAVHEIPVENLICPLCVVDIREKADADADATLTPDDLRAWISAHGEIPQGACVALNSGWQARLGGPGFRGADDDGVQHYPGFHVEAAQMLIEETGAIALATDTLSLDIGASQSFDTHYAWLPTNRYGIENLANLDQVPAGGATLIVGAPKHRGGSGGPARIMALV